MQLWDLERPDNAPAALAGHTELKGHENEVLNAAWSSDGELIASVGSDRNIRLWAIASRQELAVIPVPGDAPSRVAWGGGDEWLLAQGSTSISVSSVQELPEAGPDSSPTAIIHHQGGNINHSAWNPSGGQIITAGEDGIARIWNSETGEEIMALAGHTDAVTFAAWDPTATRIVTTSNDNTSRTWDAESGEELLILAGHAGPAAHAAWDQSGALLVTTSWDTTARLWDATTGRELAVVEGCLDAVRHVSWEPHGNRFVVTSWGGPAKIPIAALADNLEQACSYAPRNLTRTEWEQLVAGETCRKTCPNLPDACS
jgi:WD40 repeat protein